MPRVTTPTLSSFPEFFGDFARLGLDDLDLDLLGEAVRFRMGLFDLEVLADCFSIFCNTYR